MEREGKTRGDNGSSLEHGTIRPALSGAPGTQAARTQYELHSSLPLRARITPRSLGDYQTRGSHRSGADAPDTLHIVWVTLAHGTITDMPNWRAYTGQSREQVCGNGWLDAVHPDDRERVAQGWTRAMRERTSFQMMYRVRRHDGTDIAFDVRCVPVFRADGSVQEWVWSYIRQMLDQEHIASGDLPRTMGRNTHDSSHVARSTTAQDSITTIPSTIPSSPLALFIPLFEAMADAVVVYDTAGRVSFLNAAARALLNVTPSVDPAQAAAGLSIHDADGQPFSANRSPVERILQEEGLATADAEQATIILRDGRDMRVRLTGTFLRDNAGQPAGAAIILREVYDEPQDEAGRRHALGALLALAEAVIFVSDEATDSQISRAAIEVPRATGQRLAALACDVIGCAHAGILAFASENETLHPIAIAGLGKAAERAWWQQFGRAPRLDAVFEPSMLARLRADQVQIIDLHEPPYNERPNPYAALTLLVVPMLVGEQLIGILTLDYNGTPHEYMLEEIALAGAVAKLVGLVIERERLLRDRAEAQANVLALREAKRRMDEFLGVASHELRTPLTVIKANVQLLTRRIGQATSAAADVAELMANMRITPEFLDRTQRQVDRLDRLVNDLLDISRIEAGRLTLRTARIDLRVAVREAVEEQRGAWIDRTITLDLPDTALPVDADADRIGQVVTNYLTNALKYSQGDQHVSVTVAPGGESARVAVRDHGPGLTEKQREHVWERFTRISGIDVQSGSFVGLGLGLYISRTIVERHGGRVGVESAVSKGSTFWFTLPLAEAI